MAGASNSFFKFDLKTKCDLWAHYSTQKRGFHNFFFHFSLLLAAMWLSYEARILLHVIIMVGPTSLKSMAINSNSSNDSWDEIGLCHLLRKLLQQVAGIMFGVRMLAVLKKKNATNFNGWLPNLIYPENETKCFKQSERLRNAHKRELKQSRPRWKQERQKFAHLRIKIVWHALHVLFIVSVHFAAVLVQSTTSNLFCSRVNNVSSWVKNSPFSSFRFQVAHSSLINSRVVSSHLVTQIT